MEAKNQDGLVFPYRGVEPRATAISLCEDKMRGGNVTGTPIRMNFSLLGGKELCEHISLCAGYSIYY
jgi:hypothetical protein